MYIYILIYGKTSKAKLNERYDIGDLFYLLLFILFDFRYRKKHEKHSSITVMYERAYKSFVIAFNYIDYVYQSVDGRQASSYFLCTVARHF